MKLNVQCNNGFIVLLIMHSIKFVRMHMHKCHRLVRQQLDAILGKTGNES